MPGVTKHHTKRDYGRAFPASRYDDPRGGRASAIERNILRYRAAEATVYLFYAEEVRDFMLTDVHRAAIRRPGDAIWEQSRFSTPRSETSYGVFPQLRASLQKRYR
jgi:hypothetical protein